MTLFVLAGGFGTRLKTVISDTPKALAPVGNVPFLQLQINSWISQGVREFVFLLYYQADKIIDFLEAYMYMIPEECKLSWIIEPTPLDTGGSVSHAIESLNTKNSFLLTNADTWLGGGIQKVKNTNAPAIGLIKVKSTDRYGVVQFNEQKSVTAFTEKNQKSNTGWISSGLYHLNCEFFSKWDGCPFSLERDLFPSLVSKELLNAVLLDVDFIDIGIPKDYYRFCQLHSFKKI